MMKLKKNQLKKTDSTLVKLSNLLSKLWDWDNLIEK
jgi:hypothetical protein